MIFILSTRQLKQTPSQALYMQKTSYAGYLILPDEATHADNSIHNIDQEKWISELTATATTGHHPTHHALAHFKTGNILFFVHGYNSSQEEVIQRHKLLDKNLKEQGFIGTLVSVDWPCSSYTLHYLENQIDVYQSALQLVTSGIIPLAINQLNEHQNQCDINVHLLGHSTGAYVIREAFYQASKNRTLQRIHWNVSQVCFIGGDIAQKSFQKDDSKSKLLFEQSTRITNYQNPYDTALKTSNLKRSGVFSRCGRTGIPDNAPNNVVNVHCGDHWLSLIEPSPENIGNWTHSWHFYCKHFAEDLALTLMGDIDRFAIPTREKTEGQLYLKVKKPVTIGIVKNRGKQWD